MFFIGGVLKPGENRRVRIPAPSGATLKEKSSHRGSYQDGRYANWLLSPPTEVDLFITDRGHLLLAWSAQKDRYRSQTGLISSFAIRSLRVWLAKHAGNLNRSTARQ